MTTIKQWTSRLLAGAAALLCAAATGDEVNLYTDRQEVFLREVLTAHERESGDKVNVLFAKKGLLERAKAEGDSSPADVFLVTDIGRLLNFVDAELTAPATDANIGDALDKNLRDPKGHWFAVTRRVRAIYAAPGAAVNTYTDLAKPENRGVCIRSGAHPYNNALFADMISRHGRDDAAQWLRGLKTNLARAPQGKDRTQINAVANGVCNFGIANSYYYFHMLANADEERKKTLRENVAMLVPQDAHVNITGMALARHAPNPEAGQRLMKFLLSDAAQQTLAEKNFEFPARDEIPYPSPLRPYRKALENAPVSLPNIARHRRTASELVDETGFDR